VYSVTPVVHAAALGPERMKQRVACDDRALEVAQAPPVA